MIHWRESSSAFGRCWRLAIDTGLIDRRGRWTSADIADHRRGYGREDVAHVISWALRGMNPFMTGPLYDDN
jgi:hypothetical protein